MTVVIGEYGWFGPLEEGPPAKQPARRRLFRGAANGDAARRLGADQKSRSKGSGTVSALRFLPAAREPRPMKGHRRGSPPGPGPPGADRGSSEPRPDGALAGPALRRRIGPPVSPGRNPPRSGPGSRTLPAVSGGRHRPATPRPARSRPPDRAQAVTGRNALTRWIAAAVGWMPASGLCRLLEGASERLTVALRIRARRASE